MSGTFTVRDIGVPVQAASSRMLAGRDDTGQPCIYSIMSQHSRAGGLFVLQIDPETGGFRQFNGPIEANGGVVLWSDRWNALFIYASTSEVYASWLMKFDPAVGRI